MSDLKFTDEDLKRLKEHLTDHAMRTGQEFPIGQGTLDALLARLEAAEACAKQLDQLTGVYSFARDRLQTWRKAAGK